MIPLAIEAVGAVTSVGGGELALTAPSIERMVQLFGVLDAAEGEGIARVTSADAPPIGADVRDADRLFLLGRLALRECGAARERLPMVVCAPALDDFGCDTSALLDGLRGDRPAGLERNASRVLTGGRSSILEALGWAGRLLGSGEWPACLVLGIDSLVVGSNMRRPRQDGAGRGANGPTPFVPGEAGAALLLTARHDHRCAAVIAGVGHCAGDPRLKTGAAVLSRAAQGALDEAGIPASRLAAVCSDGPGSAQHLGELAMLQGRPPLSLAPDPETIIPAIAVGEVGAAAGALALVALSFLMMRGAIRGPALATFSCEGAERGAALLSPSRRAGRMLNRVPNRMPNRMNDRADRATHHG